MIIQNEAQKYGQLGIIRQFLTIFSYRKKTSLNYVMPFRYWCI